MEKENALINILIIIILLTICMACFYIVFTVTQNEEYIQMVNSIRKYTEEMKEASVETSAEVTELIEIEEKSITISVIGDIMCHNTQYNDAYNYQTGEYDFSYVFEDIKEYIQNSDLAVGNLETTFAGSAVGYSSYPTFNTPDALSSNLKELGLDVLSTANNHSLDMGYNGVVRTIEILNEAGISNVGTYSSYEDSEEILIKEINDFKIAFLAYSYGTNEIPIPKGKEYCINLINDEKIISDTKKAKEENVDLIISIIHWGYEYNTRPSNEQKRLMNLMFENGIDLIFGSHPHVLQEMEKYNIKHEDGEEKQGFVIFSLGNFMSGQVMEFTRQSVILNLVIKKDVNGRIIIDNIDYVPIYMYDRGVKKRYKLLDIEKEIEKYESGDTAIGASMYNILRKELDHIYNILPRD